MRKKRFVKLCMGRCGFDRNAAVLAARKGRYDDYDTLYRKTEGLREEAREMFGEIPVGFTVKSGLFITKFPDFSVKIWLSM